MIMIPSLCVIFLSGWDKNSYSSDRAFLETLVTSYPLIMLKNKTTGLFDFYSELARTQESLTLSSMLSSHDYEQTKISDPDHFGFLTSILNKGEKKTGEDWQFVQYPSTTSLAEYPDLSAQNMFNQAESLLKDKSGSVLFMGISNLWVQSKYGEAKVKEAQTALNKILPTFVDKCVKQGWRVLIVSDWSAKAESLPCLLAHQNLDGLRAAESDYAVAGQLPEKESGQINDLIPTILNLLRISLPENASGRPLFADLIPRTYEN